MKIDVTIWRKIKIALLIVVLLGGVAFVEYKHRNRLCEGVLVSIDNQQDEGFLTKGDINEEIQSVYTKDVRILKLIHIDAEEVENKVKNNIFVKDAEVLKNHKGKLYVSLKQEVPVLRMLTEKASSYVSKSGCRLPLSVHHTARVMMFRCSDRDSLFIGNENKIEFEKDLLDLISFINEDVFLKAQLCEVWLEKNGGLTFYPQVTKTKIIFGSCKNYESKCEKIKLFYKQILPRKGWNSYETVNVKFNDQIVCE